MTAHARVFDRRRFEATTTGGDPASEAVVQALDAYRNPDGSYGWGLEPDLRAPESQPPGALHASKHSRPRAPSSRLAPRRFWTG